MKKTLCYALAISIINLCFIFQLSAQILGFSECLDENDAFIGLDRKGWTSQESRLSESYQLDFEIPDPSPLECHEISFINISISFSEELNNIPPNCFGGFWTHAILCDSHDPISCPTSTIVYDQMGLNTNFTVTDEIENGQTLGVDIVVLINVQDPTCTPASISSGLFEADLEICIDVFYEPLDPEMELDLGDDIFICQGETIDLSGPNGFESYEWEGPIDSDEQILEDAIAGIYTLDAFDALGCRSTDEIEIVSNDEIIIEFSSNNPLSICLGSTINLSTIVNSVENNIDFDYEWTFPDNSNSSSSSINVIQSGIYIIEVIDSNTGCMSSSTFVVQETTISEAQIDSINQPQINLCEDGSIDLNAFVPALDLNNYAFEWIFGMDTTRTQLITIDQAGVYILNMHNQIGCPTTSDTISVEEVVPLSAGDNNNVTICTNEVFDLNVLLSSNAAANGEWLDNTNSIIPNGLFSSSLSNNIVNVTYLVSNESPCEDDIAFFSIFLNDENVNAGDDRTIRICNNNAEINLGDFQNGDTGGLFLNGTFEPVSNQILNTQELSIGINEFYYIVTGGSCGQDTAIISLDKLEEIETTFIQGPFCNSEEIIIGSEVFNSANPNGSVVLSSINNCDSLIEVDIMFFDIAENSVNQTLCSSEIITIGGQVFDQFFTSDTITLNNASSFGCDSIINVNLEFVNAIEAVFDQQLCEDENIIIGGQLFDISNTSDVITLLNGSSLGCDSILIVDLVFTSIVTENFNAILCSDEDIEINGEVFNESNSNGQQSFTSTLGCDSLLIIDIEFLQNSETLLNIDLCEGEEIEINNEIFNSNNIFSEQTLLNHVGCDSILNVSINLIPVSLNTMTSILCEGESIIIEGELFNANNLSGSITIENGSVNSCDSIINVEFTLVETSNTILANEICMGDSILINNIWEFNSGTYQESFTSDLGCDSIIIYEVIVNNCEINITSEIVSGISCFGNQDGIVNFILSGELNLPYTYEVINLNTGLIDFMGEITSDNLTLSNLFAGEYELNLFSSNGEIIASDLFNLNRLQELIIGISKDDIICLGDPTGNLNLDIQGGTPPYEYLWNTGETTPIINQLTAGSYSYTVTDFNNCALNGSISIIEPEEITASVIVSNANCFSSEDGSLEVLDISGGTPEYTFSLDGNNFTPNNIFDNLGVGSYQVFITDGNGCIKEFDASVDFESMNLVDNFIDIDLIQGDSTSIVLNLDFSPENIVWLPTTTISCDNCLAPTFFPTETTSYVVQVEDEFGCIIEQSITINVLIPDIDQVFVPNVFTPNDQNSSNNLFKPFFSPDADIDFLNLSIFDRWGNLVYTENNELKGWDGRSNGRKIAQGVYVYFINYIDNNGDLKRIVGDITLIR